MGYKVKKTLKDNKISIIVIIILWIILSIVFVAPVAYSIGKLNATNGGAFNFGEFFTMTFSEISTFSSIGRVFSEGYGGTFGQCLLYFSILFFICAFIGLWKSKPKHQYTDIEHGSSDWSEGGEQYAVLNKHKGIILAQDNYLPVDKRGNVNVLVVGRFWLW